jgi:MoxR-like ATPase
MYNLLITSHDEAWEERSGSYQFSIERFLEYTDPELRTQFRQFDEKTIDRLRTLPTLFAYEVDLDKPARVGRITAIERKDSWITLSFEIPRDAPSIDSEEFVELQGELGITESFELNRTHWAVKDANLLEVLGRSRGVSARDRNLLASANRLALKAVRSILAAAEPFELNVEGVSIRVVPQRLPPIPWPRSASKLNEAKDGPWPQSVLLDCSWQNGSTQLVASAERAAGSYRDLVAIHFRARLDRQRLVWINVAAALRKDAVSPVPITASFSLATHIPDDPHEKARRERRSSAAKLLVRRSGLPVSNASVDAFALALPDAEVEPSPAVVFRRLTHLALLKLPFWVKEQADAINGTPYLDPDDSRWGEAGASFDAANTGDAVSIVGSLQAPNESEAEEPAAPEPDATAGVEPHHWSAPRLVFDIVQFQPYVAQYRLHLPESLIAQICAALSSGKHLLLVGPPGTGKTEIARALGDSAREAAYCNGTFAATASADWSTFDTIGGYTMDKDEQFTFRPGVFLRAIEQRKWLLLDEVNRADIDRCFGELMTVLAGGRIDTPFTQRDGSAISIGPGLGDSHRMPPTFRVLATMNTWDKTSLFRLSYAVQRRFAVINIPTPDDERFSQIVDDASKESGDAMQPLGEAERDRMKRLFRRTSLLRYREVGPATAIDMIRYQRHRRAESDGFIEAVSLFLLPQLQGLDAEPASRVFELLREELRNGASQEALRQFRTQYSALFPAATLVD